MKRRHKWLLAVVLAVLAALLLAWEEGKGFLEARLKADLARHGITQLDFHVGAITPHGITFDDIRFGSGLKLDSLTIGYHLLELLRGDVRSADTGELIFRQGDTKVKVKEMQAAVTNTPGGRRGQWRAHAIQVEDAPVDLPALEGKGDFSWENGEGKLTGDIANANRIYKAVFALRYPQVDKKTTLTISSASMPWNGGRLLVRSLTIPLYGNAPIHLPLQLQGLPLDTLVQKATNKRASATGIISGTVPVRFERNGNFMLEDGSLKAEGAGVLHLPPDIIPGGNEQVDVLRTLLSDFHYSALTLTLDEGKNGALSMLLSLSGNNPAVYDGRQVDLNVKLGGDVLDFVKQSLSLEHPRRLMEHTHENGK